MKALTVRQPWAWAIIRAGKDIENRSWATKHRGPLIIHAAAGMTRREYEDCLDTMHAISRRRPFPSGLAIPEFGALERGGIVGMVCVLGMAYDQHRSPWFYGPVGWMLAAPMPLPFRPMKGRLGLFEVEL